MATKNLKPTKPAPTLFPVESVPDCMTSILARDVTFERINRRQSPVTTTLVITDKRGIEVGKITFRLGWLCYIFEPRDGVILNSLHSGEINALLHAMTMHHNEVCKRIGKELSSGKSYKSDYDPAKQSPATDLQKMTPDEYARYIK